MLLGDARLSNVGSPASLACAVCFFPFYHCCSSTCIRNKYHDHLAFCSSEELASRKGTPAVNTVNNGSVENCVNSETCISGCGGSSLRLGVSCLSPQSGVQCLSPQCGVQCLSPQCGVSCLSPQCGV